MTAARSNRSVNGQVVVVTGAASGIGAAIARLLAAENAAVGLLDRDAARLSQVAEEIAGAGGVVHAVVTDVGDQGAVSTAVEELRGSLGPLDAIVNNAALPALASLDAPEFDEQWQASLDINLTAYLSLVRSALPDLRRDRGGRVVNIASTDAFGAIPGALPYVVAKHAVVGLTRALAVELGGDAVTVNCICPGPIDTPMTASIPAEAKDRFARRRTALGRYGTAEEVAQMTLSLLLPASSYTTGSVLVVDGGLTIRHA
jgi:3-oxoacyl-[acyl-carrier protein] reductase